MPDGPEPETIEVYLTHGPDGSIVIRGEVQAVLRPEMPYLGWPFHVWKELGTGPKRVIVGGGLRVGKPRGWR